MELKGTYKVTKIKVDKENSDRFVKIGDNVVGEIQQLSEGLSMVVVGDGKYDNLITSPVVKIETANGENLLVGTRNSTYSLEKVVDN